MSVRRFVPAALLLASLLLVPGCVSRMFLSGSFELWPGSDISFPVGGRDIVVTLTNDGPGTVTITREGGWFEDDEVFVMEPGESRTYATTKKRYFHARNDSPDPTTLLVGSLEAGSST